MQEAIKEIPASDRSKKTSPYRLAKKTKYSGSRWAGLILLIITFVVSLFFYARGGLDPAKYSIQK